MGKVTGFMEYERLQEASEAPQARTTVPYTNLTLTTKREGESQGTDALHKNKKKK